MTEIDTAVDYDRHLPHDPLDQAGHVNTIFFVAVSANLAFTVLEATYAYIADSVSLLGDAGHNLGDVLGLLLAWGAAYLAGKKTSRMYSYGYRRTTILAAIINALVLVFAASLIAFESLEKFIQPTPIQEIPVIVVASIGIVVNTGAAWLFIKGSKKDLNLKAAFLHLAYDALISVGVVVTATAILYTGWMWLDPLAAVMIVVIITWGAWGLLRDSVNLILDAVPQGIDRTSVENYLHSIDGVTKIHDVHIWGMSTNENGLTAHLIMPDNSLWESETGYAEISRQMQERFNIHHITLQVEKDQDCANEDCD
ncbi:MAG: cation diffusion facilitator family transporter [Pseudomonadales bacterium]|nr:cation diffusion facilitator family transporter [Pseudomonadales bacterium]MDP7358460.1 cation diffusion facilitator family transporter [Pseudomonadales bacterium]MDP7594903.1 cation diffusion facilitator family transporter [Pseudomonadales bacterium]HJN49152.1 cation diffusion facilitator family transporter [Pseudomonadales bacterium]